MAQEVKRPCKQTCVHVRGAWGLGRQEQCYYRMDSLRVSRCRSAVTLEETVLCMGIRVLCTEYLVSTEFVRPPQISG